jgi:hypothetical protein
VNAKETSQTRAEALEVQAKYAALEKEIRLLLDLRSQVMSQLKKQVQLHVRRTRRIR